MRLSSVFAARFSFRFATIRPRDEPRCAPPHGDSAARRQAAVR
ncbi:hypothetical protein OH687_25110 [Burkholderia anthina]|nr:hypothetical protein OH687_25110 [Burkholderia anthina]